MEPAKIDMNDERPHALRTRIEELEKKVLDLQEDTFYLKEAVKNGNG